MTKLAIISTIIGIIAGVIAIFKKAFGIFGGMKIFKDEFGRWVKERVRNILSLQNGKAEQPEKWRTAFAEGQLGMKPGEEIPHYDPEPWDKQRDRFPALDKPRETAGSEVYHFYQSASLHQHYVLRKLLPEHELVVI